MSVLLGTPPQQEMTILTVWFSPRLLASRQAAMGIGKWIDDELTAARQWKDFRRVHSLDGSYAVRLTCRNRVKSIAVVRACLQRNELWKFCDLGCLQDDLQGWDTVHSTSGQPFGEHFEAARNQQWKWEHPDGRPMTQWERVKKSARGTVRAWKRVCSVLLSGKWGGTR